MPEHTSPWRVSDAQSYEALRDKARRFIAEALAASRSGASTDRDTEQAILRTRNALFDQGWSSSHTGSGVGL